jgi:SAM-dependent methyltransferase
MAYVRARVYQDEVRRIVQRVFDEAVGGQPLNRVLDVGCGYELPLDLPASAQLVGLDVSAEALERNENLDEKMLGDIESVEFAAETFDAIICWTVMEHLPHPEEALRSFATWLRGAASLLSACRISGLEGPDHEAHAVQLPRVGEAAALGQPGSWQSRRGPLQDLHANLALPPRARGWVTRFQSALRKALRGTHRTTDASALPTRRAGNVCRARGHHAEKVGSQSE